VRLDCSLKGVGDVECVCGLVSFARLWGGLGSLYC